MRIIAALLIATALVGCSQEKTASNVPDDVAAEQSAAVAKSVDATSVTNALKGAGLPIDGIKVVTEENDPNNMIGRPGGYISKTYFYDGRHKGEGAHGDEQNALEVFATEADATKRREYVEKVTEGVPMLTQYIIQKGTVVLRLDKVLKPSEAKAYEDALAKI